MRKEDRYASAVSEIFDTRTGRMNEPDAVREVFDCILTPDDLKQFGLKDIEGNVNNIDPNDTGKMYPEYKRYESILQQVADVYNDTPSSPSEFEVEDFTDKISIIGDESLTLKEKINLGWEENLDVTEQDIKNFEKNGMHDIDDDLVAYRISESTHNYGIDIYLDGIAGWSIEIADYSISFDGTLHGLCDSLDKFIKNFDPVWQANDLNSNNEFTYVELHDKISEFNDVLTKVTEDVNAIKGEVQNIYQEVYERNMEERMANLQVSQDVLDTIDNSPTLCNDGIFPNEDGTFTIKINSPNIYPEEYQTVFDGTDNGLMEALQQKMINIQNEPSDIVEGIAFRENLDFEDAIIQTKDLCREIDKLQESIGDVISEHELLADIEDIRNDISESGNTEKVQSEKSEKKHSEPSL